MSFTVDFITHDTLNTAPGSTANFSVITSPSIYADAFNVSVPVSLSFPIN